MDDTRTRLAVGVVFLSAAVQKTVGVETFRTVLSAQIPWIDRWSIWSILITTAIVAFESAIAVSLFCRFELRKVSIGAIMLLAAFSVVLLTLMARGRTSVPCGCGTIIDLNPAQGMIRNILLMAIFGVIAWKGGEALPRPLIAAS